MHPQQTLHPHGFRYRPAIVVTAVVASALCILAMAGTAVLLRAQLGVTDHACMMLAILSQVYIVLTLLTARLSISSGSIVYHDLFRTWSGSDAGLTPASWFPFLGCTCLSIGPGWVPVWVPRSDPDWTCRLIVLAAFRRTDRPALVLALREVLRDTPQVGWELVAKAYQPGARCGCCSYVRGPSDWERCPECGTPCGADVGAANSPD